MSVATRAAPLPARVGDRRWMVPLAVALGLALLGATVAIVLDAAVSHKPLVPRQPAIASWLAGPGERLTYRVFLTLLLVASGAYAGLLVLGARGRAGAFRRPAVALVIALQLIVFAGPILLSTDVFSYIAYARMGVEHGLNPYVYGPAAIRSDPIYGYVGEVWRHVATAYGPVYTLLTYPLAPLGVVGAVWGMKVVALLASGGTLALTWLCARRRALDPVFALLAVGANPLYVVYGLGGAHNDLLMMLVMMAAVALTLAPRPTARSGAAAGALIVAGALIKATVAALLPFMLIARRRPAELVGALAALLGFGLIAYDVFGVHGLDVVAALNRDAALVSSDSFATEIAHLFGKPGVFPVDHALLKAALVAIVLHLLWRTWRGYDWVAASAWTLLAIAVTSTWLLPWYILWPLPLAVVVRDRRLLVATLAIQGLFVVHQLSPLFASVQ